MNLGLQIRLAQNRVQVLLDKIGLPFFDHQHRAFAAAESLHFFVNQRIGYVQHVQRNLRVPECIGQAQQFQRPHGGVVHAALQNDAEILRIFGETTHSSRGD